MPWGSRRRLTWGRPRQHGLTARPASQHGRTQGGSTLTHPVLHSRPQASRLLAGKARGPLLLACCCARAFGTQGCAQLERPHRKSAIKATGLGRPPPVTLPPAPWQQTAACHSFSIICSTTRLGFGAWMWLSTAYLLPYHLATWARGCCAPVCTWCWPGIATALSSCTKCAQDASAAGGPGLATWLQVDTAVGRTGMLP